MSGQGYHLALDRDQVDELLSCVDEFGILDWVRDAGGRALGRRHPRDGGLRMAGDHVDLRSAWYEAGMEGCRVVCRSIRS